jgi:NAD(P)-dependent dehydrogenase (short-subunit alcohol dehydrogenase family)
MLDLWSVNSFRLDGRAILITGATGHLGRPIALAIAQSGGIPVVAGRTESKLSSLADEIARLGGISHSVAFDIAQPKLCRDAIARIANRLDALSGIVNCAYGGRPGTLNTATDADFESAFSQNLTGPFAIVQAALPLLQRGASTCSGGASIVNVASMYGHVSPDPRIYADSGKNNPPYYGAAKAGLLQLTRYLAAHLGPQGIRVNSISPGPFPSPSLRSTSPEFHSQLCAKTVLGRIGAANEMVGPVLFLLSDAASFVTGSDLSVDGGWTAW